MDLFDNEFESVSLLPVNSKRKRNKSTPHNCLKMRFTLYKEFTTALQHCDRRLLNFLLSDKQESKHWTTKQDFIDKYLSACKKFETEQAIKITTHNGIGRLVGIIGWQHGIAVVIDSLEGEKRLWKFDLAFRLDELSKIKIDKCKILYSQSAFAGQPTNEFFPELPHANCAPPKPKPS